MRFLDRLAVVVVPRRLRQQEQIFMALRRPVGDRLWHRVGFGPDDVGAEPPAVGLKREGDAPGDADEVFRLKALSDEALPPMVYDIVATLRAWQRISISAPGLPPRVRIPEIHPTCAIGPQHPPHLAEDLDEMLDAELWRRFEPEDAAPGAAGAEGSGRHRASILGVVFIARLRPAPIVRGQRGFQARRIA